MQHWSDSVDTEFARARSVPGPVAGIGATRTMDVASREGDVSIYAKAFLRKRQTQRRLQWLHGLWDDEACFEAIVASGRYLKLCALLEWASTNDENADWRLQNCGVGAIENAVARS